MTLLLLTLWCFFSSCSLFQKYTEHQPHSHCSPWFSCLCSLCSQVTGGRYPHKSSMGLTTSLVKTGLKRSKSSVSEEQRKQNTERTRSGYMKPDYHSILDVSNIHHFTSTTSPASCTPSSTTTTCQIRHSLLRSEYYGCRKAFTGKHLAQHWCNCKVINNT